MRALSLKQPWATLLAHGRKSIEVRKWSTPLRGRILIHAAKVCDPRPEVWARVPSELLDATRLVGGIVGAADLVGCIAYRTLDDFTKDIDKHWNDPTWFQPPVLYGFTFVDPTPLTFHRVPGWMRFFEVDLPQEQS